MAVKPVGSQSVRVGGFLCGLSEISPGFSPRLTGICERNLISVASVVKKGDWGVGRACSGPQYAHRAYSDAKCKSALVEPEGRFLWRRLDSNR